MPSSLGGSLLSCSAPPRGSAARIRESQLLCSIFCRRARRPQAAVQTGQLVELLILYITHSSVVRTQTAPGGWQSRTLRKWISVTPHCPPSPIFPSGPTSPQAPALQPQRSCHTCFSSNFGCTLPVYCCLPHYPSNPSHRFTECLSLGPISTTLHPHAAVCSSAAAGSLQRHPSICNLLTV